MNQEYPHLIETDETSHKNKFPILAQLGILSILMFGLFASILSDKQPIEEQVVAVETERIQYQEEPIPLKISVEDVKIKAKSAYVWDAKTQRSLYSKNEYEELPLASITKLMTALLAHELIDTKQTTTVSQNAIKQEGSSGLSEGEKLKAEELLDLALVSSSNDAAYALAASVGSLLGKQDPTSQFIQGMNIKADMLGLDTLQFWNTTGLDLSTTQPGSVGSAKDVTFLMEHIVKNYPELLSPTQRHSVRVFNTEGIHHDAHNTNSIIDNIPNLIGSKTGFTDLAGGNLTVAFDIGLDHPIIITVLGSTREERFSDVLSLVVAVQESIK